MVVRLRLIIRWLGTSFRLRLWTLVSVFRKMREKTSSTDFYEPKMTLRSRQMGLVLVSLLLTASSRSMGVRSGLSLIRREEQLSTLLFQFQYNLPACRQAGYNSGMKNILIIEDDVFLGDVLLEKFKKEGFEAHLSRDGAEGLAEMKKFKPDLILLDIILPTMNGYEILEAKQKDPEIEKIPVIIISNSGQPVEINRALALGVKDYFIKAQFDPEEV